MSELTVGLSSSTVTANDTTNDSETAVEINNLVPTVLSEVRPRRRRCVCQVVKSDCQYLTRELKEITKEIVKIDPTASGAVRHTLQNAQIQLRNIHDHLKGDLLKNVPDTKARTESLLLERRSCFARDHHHHQQIAAPENLS